MKAEPLPSPSRRKFGLVLALLGVAPLFGVAACPAQKPAEPLVKPGSYQDSPEELHRLWSDILLACQKDDRNRVHDLMASLIMTPAELTSLIGPEQASVLGARYQAMLGSLVNAGAVELVAHVYEKKYDDVAVVRIDNAPVEDQADTDRAVRKALVKPVPFYTVRVKRKTESKGLRYDFFVYQDGFWRSGNLLGKWLPPAEPLAPAAVDGGTDAAPTAAAPAPTAAAPAPATAPTAPAPVPTKPLPAAKTAPPASPPAPGAAGPGPAAGSASGKP